MACIPFFISLVVSLLRWGRPSGCIIPRPLGLGPAACIPSAFISNYASCLITRHRPRHLSFFMSTTCTLKGGVPEHCDSGLLLALQPSPSGLVHGIATKH